MTKNYSIVVFVACSLSLLVSGVVRDETSVHVPAPTLPRMLQGDCDNANAFSDHYFSVMGPVAASEDSKFQRFGFNLSAVEGILGNLFPIPIVSLAEPLSANRWGPGFVQELETFGRNGEHTSEILQQNELLKEFWGVSEDRTTINVLGVHSEDLQSQSSMEQAIRYYIGAFGGENLLDALDEATLASLAVDAQSAIETELPDNYTNPVLSFGSRSWEGRNIEGNVIYSILLGDGDRELYSHFEFEQVSNSVTHAYFFSRTLIKLAAWENVEGDFVEYVAVTRDLPPDIFLKTSLLSDSTASYFLAHSEGGNLDLPLLMEAINFAAFAGNCNVTLPTHPGTPPQRKCASLWGARLGLQPVMEPLSFIELQALFEEEFQQILDLDSTVCAEDLRESPTSSPGESTASPTAATPQSPTPASAMPTPVPSLGSDAPSNGTPSPDLTTSSACWMNGKWSILALFPLLQIL